MLKKIKIVILLLIVVILSGVLIFTITNQKDYTKQVEKENTTVKEVKTVEPVVVEVEDVEEEVIKEPEPIEKEVKNVDKKEVVVIEKKPDKEVVKEKEITVEYLRELLNKNPSQSEFESTLGIEGIQIISSMDGLIHYRYDLNFPNNYLFEATKNDDGIQIDDWDIEGIREHKGIMVFVSFEYEEYLISYHNEKTNQFNALYKFPDGFEKTDEYNYDEM